MCGDVSIRERVSSSQRDSRVLIKIGETKCSFWTASLVSLRASLFMRCVI